MSEKDFKYLIDILNDDELRQLSSYVKIKLESHLEGKQLAIDNMKTQLAKSAANAEKKSFAVDRELQNTKSKLQMSEEFVDKLKNQLKGAEEALQKSRHDYYEILESKDLLTYELNGIKEKVKRFNDEKLDLTDMLSRRQEQIQSLQNELKTICSKLKTNSEGRLETSVRAEELELKMISVEHQEIRMSQERQLYQKQIQSLNEELNAKINELLALRRDRTIQILELQSNLEQKTDENTKYLEEVKHLKQIIEKKDKHIESLAQRICEMQNFGRQLEEDFQNEITAQNNLIELHKNSNIDLKKQNENLIEIIEDMQKLVQSAKEAHTDLESVFNESQTKFNEQLNESLDQNSLLIKELEELKETVANTSRDNLESEFEKQYPLAANTKKLLGKNMSFTQIFNELVAKQQELDDQKSENTVLREHLQHLTTEAEENGPLLHRKIQEHQRALQNISELQNQISSLIIEREQWIQEKDTLFRIGKQYEREIKRFENENKDLAKQIRALIKSVQEARGFTVTEGQDSQISSSDGTLPQELITFKNIEELQVRNQELMNALRETNEKLRKLENEKNDQQMHSLRNDLEESLLQLENLRTERRQQTELFEALVKQRDAYKMLSSHSTPDAAQAQKSPVPFNTSVNTINSEEYNKIKLNLENIKNEYQRHREESANKIQVLGETSEKLREELSNFKIESAKISSELVFTLERLQMFKTNGEQFQRENALLRERNTILNENSKKQEQNLILMRQELIAVNEKLNRNEMNIESIKSERDLYRNNEIKLLQEKELMIRTHENQNKLINTLQSVQNNMTQLETDTIRNLRAQNSKLEKEVSYLRIKCEKDSERHSEASLLWDKHSQELQNRLDSEIEKYLKAHKELTEYQTKAKNLENELNSIKTGVNQMTLESNVLTDADRALQTQLVVIREQFSEAQNEIKLLREKLSNAQKASESLRSINSTLEERLNEHKLTTEEIEEKANSIISEKENTIKSLTKELTEFKERYKQLYEEKSILETDHKNTSQQYLERINKLTNSLIEANSNAEKAILNEKRVLEDKNNQMAIASEAQANYERELLQHSRDAQSINSLQKQLTVFQNKVYDAESAAKKAQEQLNQSHQLWETEKIKVSNNIQKLREKCNDLERINDTLHQQLELLNNKIIGLQNNSNLPLLTKEEEIENTNRLLEVIKFLRKEKEVLQTQITAFESEDSRHKLIVDNLKKELTHVQNELKEERLNSENIITNVSQHNEMVKKIEMINILSDSNAMLRNEKKNLETKCEEMENKLKQIDSQKLSKNIEELNLKIETKNAETLALREEIKHWQKRTNNLTEQINKTSPEDMKRLNEEKTKLQQQITNLNQDLNKLNAELESHKNSQKILRNQLQEINKNLETKTNESKKLSEELNGLKTENQTNQNTIIQLRKVARKYKMQFDELKAQFDKINENKDNSSNISPSTSSELQSAELLQKVEELNNKIKELDQRIAKSNSDLNQITEERDSARAQALEKEEKAKKIAHQAKQRLATISTEKINILKEKESLQKSIEELNEKIKQLEQTIEENSLRMASIKSQYEAKSIRLEKELTEALKQIENLKTRQQIPTQTQLQSTSSAICVSTASVQTSQSPSNPVRHSVHPQPATLQPLSAKSTPTASIRPLAVAPTLHRAGRSPNVSTRTATVATVQPTTEELTPHQSVPRQATVQPTQTVSSQMAFVPPNTNTETEIVSQNEEQMEELSQSSQNNEISETQVNRTFIDDNFEPSIAEEVAPHSETRTEESEPSTSIRIDRNREGFKRTRKSSDELIPSLSSKKQKIEIIRSQVVEDEDDDIIILDSNSDESDVEQREQNENEDNADDEEEEDDEEEDEEYDDNEEENVEESEEVYGEDNEEYNEEEEEESRYEDEQNEDNSNDNDEDIEVVGVSDDMPEMNTAEDDDERQAIPTETSTVETIDLNVSTSMSSLPVTTGVTSSTESNPFIQIPTPIQRPGFGTSGRQSFYLSQTQSSTYDEGDGIVPSTPTLIVPRRGDSFADALNSPRVPQSRFVFSASIPESNPTSQLATETTLGVDDTRMDLSQFDDNNSGRSVPTTPLATSPANNTVHSTVQNIDVDNDSNPNFGIDPNESETVVPTEFETDSTNIEIETIDVNRNVNTDMNEGIDSNTELQESNRDETQTRIETESIPTSTSNSVQTARRGRAFGPQRATLQRRPILPPSSPISEGVSSNRQPLIPSVQQNQQQIQNLQQSGRTIRLRNSGFATRGNFRGRPNRGSRGGYHYNN